MSFLFYFFDPVASFADGSPGLGQQRLFGSSGPRLGFEAWQLGRRAYELLSTEGGAAVTADDLKKFIVGEGTYMAEFFEALNEAATSGRIKLVKPDGKTPISPPITWEDTEYSWQVTTMVRFMHSLPTSGSEPVAEAFGAPMLVAALALLDSAISYSLSDDAEAVSACLLDAAWLVERVESLDESERHAQTLQRRIDHARASAGGKARHAKDPKRAAREFVRDCWKRWRREPSQYASASAFARAMLDKQPELLTSEVVVTRWVRSWDREAE